MPFSFSAKNMALSLAVVIGIFLVFSSIDLQGYLSTGDHGRDLYAFERTLHGDMPYRDYWWVYGPLMPFYYAFFMKCFGVNILSVLAGKALLKLAAGLFLFFGLARMAHPLAALLGTVWFFLFSQEFFFTYNHMGGTLCICAIASMLLSYAATRRDGNLLAAALISMILCFIKLNFGLAGLAATAAAAFITDSIFGIKTAPAKRFFYRSTLIYIPLIVGAAYAILLRGLEWYEIRQCMPYATADHPYNTTPWAAIAGLWTLFVKKLFTSPLDFFFAGVMAAVFIRIAFLFWRRRLLQENDKRHLAGLAVLAVYFTLNLHEYLRSGTWYTSLWSQPLEFMFFFLAISLAIRQNGRALRAIVLGIIALLAFTGWKIHAGIMTQLHTPGQYMSHDNVKAYVINDQGWIKTVEDTAAFLDQNLQPREQFFALPYDPIYYYLTGRKSPVQLLIFFEHINIRPPQEERIIATLEQKHINWIVVSSRMKTQEPGLGTLGITYGPLIGKYLQENFKPVVQFGDWQHDAGWGWNHGTVVLKRK